VPVIGAGGAGLRAAIAATAAGARTVVVSKSLLGKAHTVMAEGGVAASLGNVDPADDWKTHFQDTLFGGKYLNNWRMDDMHAKEAPERVIELEHWGAVFDRTHDQRMSQRAFGGHTYKRLVHIGDRTGRELIRTVQDRAVHGGAEVYMEYTITRLLRDEGRICGAFGYRRATGDLVIWRARSVVMASGGSGELFPINSNSWEGAGDRRALALHVGATLIDMEFVQFHPTGMVWPPGVIGLLVTEAVRGEGGILRNSEGERFMERYDRKRMELSTRDVVARAIYTEVREGRGTPHGGVFLDVSHLPATTVRKRLPSMYDQFMELAGVDITREPMEVGPTCHYIMGGVKVDAETGATSVPGLFACGECSGGMNGANRLGGNSLSDLLVFGKRAGEGAAAAAAAAAVPAIDQAGVAEAEAELDGYFAGGGDEDPYELHTDLQSMLQENVGIFREESGLVRALDRLEEYKERLRKVHVPVGSRAWNPSWNLCRDLKNMLTVAEAITRAALMREESRGAHSRLAFPQFGAYWGPHNIAVTKTDDGRIAVEPVPVVTVAELEPLVEERKAKEAAG